MKNKSKHPPRPSHSTKIGKPDHPIWMVGNWSKQEQRVFDMNGAHYYFLGHCFASDSYIKRLIQKNDPERTIRSLTQLHGNYNLLILRDEHWSLYTDIAGMQPLFYYEDEDYYAFSSSQVALGSLAQTALDPSWISLRMIAPGAIPVMRHDRSAYLNVYTVGPGKVLDIDFTGISISEYWSPPNADDKAHPEKLRESLVCAVSNRLEMHPINSGDLSGGLDSSTLTLIAANRLKEQNDRFPAITQAAHYESEDMHYAKLMADRLTNVDHIVMKPKEDHFSGIKNKMPLTDDPSPFTNLNKMMETYRLIRNMNSTIHLSGEGGDSVLMAPHSYLADLFRKKKYKLFFSHVYGWARFSGIPPTRLARRVLELSMTPYPKWLRIQADLLQKRIEPATSLGWLESPIFSDWLTDASYELAAAEFNHYACTSKPTVNHPGQFASVAGIQTYGRYLRSIQQQLSKYGVHISYPYLDAPVIQQCLTAPVEEKSDPYRFKPLLTNAFHKDLPESFLNRKSKGNYHREYQNGLRRKKEDLLNFFKDSILEEMKLIDYSNLHRSFSGNTPDTNLIPMAIQSINMELWLRTIHQSALWHTR